MDMLGVGGKEDPKEVSSDGGKGLMGGLGVVLPLRELLLSKLLDWRGAPTGLSASLDFLLPKNGILKGEGERREFFLAGFACLLSDAGGRLNPRGISGVHEGMAEPTLVVSLSLAGDLPRKLCSAWGPTPFELAL